MDISLLLGLALACALLAVAVAAIKRRRREVRILATPVLVGEAMMRKGITPADAAAAGREAEVFSAVARCAACTSDAECRAALIEGASEDLPAQCPNREFFAHVAAHKDSLRTEPPVHLSGRITG